MAVDNKRIRVNELEFEDIKNNLKNFLKGQAEFTDYDFEGSGMSVLLDVLAYNTHYNALYTNMAINEMFLDSAVKRSSIASHAATLGYTPKSILSPRALVNITVSNVPNNPPVLTFPDMQPFAASTATSQGSSSSGFLYYNRDAYVTERTSDNKYIFTNVELTEGTPRQFKFIVEPGTKFILPNDNIDTTTVSVRVQDTVDSPTFVNYTLSNSIVNADSSSKVFYMREVENQLFEIYFGDGIISDKPPVGSVVIVDYFLSSGPLTNNTRIFSYSGVNVQGGTITVTTTSPSSGGAEAESNESIKFNAVKQFSAQNRTVTSEDYKIIVPQLFPNVDTISVWGGEENDPPIYGRVFIAIKPKTGLVLSQSAKQTLVNDILSSRNVVSITPTIVDPTYLNVVLEITYYYNPLKTKLSVDTISSLIKTTISQYNATELKDFDSVFRLSRLQRLIDTTEDSIVSSVVKVKLAREIVPNFNNNSSYTINLFNPIYNEPGSTAGSNIISTGFQIGGNNNTYFFDDDTFGNLRLFYLSSTGLRVYQDNTAGTVNYATGKIIINSINVASAPGNIITFTIEPSSYDVVSVRDQLVRIDETKTIMYGIPDRVASGEYSSGSNYIFTPNR